MCNQNLSNVIHADSFSIMQPSLHDSVQMTEPGAVKKSLRGNGILN